LARGKILVIDDDPDNREILDYNLSREGFEVICARDAGEGLSSLEAQKPDLIILDLVMPGVDGIELCQQLKSDPDTRQLPVIMVTAKNEESDVILGLGVGADDYISKPFKSKELIARVRSALRRGPIRESDQLKLAAMENYVRNLEDLLGMDSADPDDEILSLAPLDKTFRPTASSGKPLELPPIDSVLVVKDEEIEPLEEKPTLEELESRASLLRRTLRDDADLRIKTPSGPDTLSLHYFSVSDGAPEKLKIIDLERFVICNRLALDGALTMARKLYHDADKTRRKAVFRRIKQFLETLFNNLREMLSPQGNGMLPYTGNKINCGVLFNFAAMLSLNEWESADDVEVYLELFDAKVEWPLMQLLEDPLERRKYFESIVFP